jgi:cellulose 1,4-beta-cellobiosidase
VTGNAKTYLLGTNWWGQHSGQSIVMDGLGFRIDGHTPNQGGNAPAGFPTMFIGDYQGRTNTCSNLPMRVSDIQEIPTVFDTNATSLDTSNFNAAYDVWFTSSSSPLPSSQDNPGSGGAYLMVWLYKPSNRQPVGSPQGGARSVAGVPGSWTPWYGQGYAAPVVSYVSSSPMSDLTFDLNDFIEDAVANNLGVRNDHYLSIVFAGFEVWGGGNGAEVERFCVDVR